MRKDLCIKAFLAVALAAALVGCTTLPPPDAGVTRKSAASKVGAKHLKVAGTATRQARSVRYGKRTQAAANPTQAATTTGSIAAQPKSKSDPVTKAKAAIAAMLEDPTSAEFSNVRRAQKNLLHRRVDTICGQVRAKGASGGGSGGMPFLYIVGNDREDEAYLVNGRSHVAETVHGALCK